MKIINYLRPNIRISKYRNIREYENVCSKCSKMLHASWRRHTILNSIIYPVRQIINQNQKYVKMETQKKMHPFLVC